MPFTDLYGVPTEFGSSRIGGLGISSSGSPQSQASKIASSFKATPDTSGLQRVASYAEQDRAQGIANYNEDRSRFYSGQSAANAAKMGAYNTNLNWINEDRTRYAQVFQPLEERLASLAAPTAEAYSQAEGKASADVNQSFASAQAQMAREAGRLGINPSSGRFAAMMGNNSLEQTAAMTGALSNARAGVDNRAAQALQLGLDVGQRYRQTQQITAPELDYNVMGPRQANGLEAALPSVQSNISQLKQQANQAAADKAWQYFIASSGLGRSSGGGSSAGKIIDPAGGDPYYIGPGSSARPPISKTSTSDVNTQSGGAR